MEAYEQKTDLRQVTAMLRRRWLLIATTVLLAAGAAFGVSKLQTAQYDATAKLLFRDPGYAQALFGTTASTTGASTDPARQAETNLDLVGLKVIDDRTSRALGGAPTSSQVSATIAVSAEGQSDVVLVTATDPSPAKAKLLANTFARQFLAFRAQTDRSKLLQAKRLAKREFESLPPDQQSGGGGQALSRATERLGVLASLQTGNAELVQPADLPSSPSSPKPIRNAVLGVILGLLLGVALAFLSERLNRRLRSPEEAREAFDLPILGVIPDSPFIATGQSLTFADQEAFRMLRSTLRYFNVDQDVRSVLVTSARSEEGKTTVAWHLAAVAARNARVILVEADLREPSLSRQHGLSPSPGLAEFLTNQSNLEELLPSVAVADGSDGGGQEARFDVIVAGAVPPNPVELIDSRAMRDLISRLKANYDLVVIDTPPTTIVSDAFPLVTQVSGVICVCRLGQITRDSAKTLREQLDRLRAPLLGVVANRAKRKSQAYGNYGYGDSATRGDDALEALSLTPPGQIHP